MTVQTVPYAEQNASHSAALFRQSASAAFVTGGILGVGELAVSAQSSPNMSVILGPGRAKVVGTSVTPPAGLNFTTQGMYDVLNDANFTVTVTASDPTNPRIDALYIQVQDSFYSGSNNQAVPGIVAGVPSSSPFAPAVPANSTLIEYIAVGANVTSIVAGNLSPQVQLATVLAPPITQNPGVSAIVTSTPSQTVGTTTTPIVWSGTGTLKIRGGATFNQYTGVMTCTKAGAYRVYCQVTFNAAANGVRVLVINVNGTDIIATLQVSANITTLAVSHVVTLALGDTVQIVGISGVAVTIGVAGDAYYSVLNIDYIG